MKTTEKYTETLHLPSVGERPIEQTRDDTQASSFTFQQLSVCSNEDARKLIPFEQAREFNLLPLSITTSKSSKSLHCAIAQESLKLLTHQQREDLKTKLRFIAGMQIIFTEAPQEVVSSAILQSYLGAEELLRDKLRSISSSPAIRTEQPKHLDIVKEVSGDIAQFLSTLLQHVTVRGASDLHLLPTPMGGVVKMRLGGELLTQNETPYPLLAHEQLISRLKVLAKLDTTKKHLPLDGSFTFTIADQLVSARLSTMPTINGESAVIRLLFSKEPPKLSSLGIEATTHQAVLSAINRSSGLVLLSGPTGSGKTTTLYAALLEVHKQSRSVVCVEDPVEIPLSGIVQVQVKQEVDLDYPRAIRAALRHDPDALLIGEIRDSASAKIALQSSTTGHLTLSSVHARSTLEVLSRLTGLGVARDEVVDALALVINQRLIPKLCSRCKVIDLASTRAFKATVYQRVGCPSCGHSGFFQRALISEALIISDYETRTILTENVRIPDLLEHLPYRSFIPWRVSLEEALLRGDISALQFGDFLDKEVVE